MTAGSFFVPPSLCFPYPYFNFRTVWEVKQRLLIDMAAERGAYICQSQSLNLFIAGTLT